jgi:uncharacterized membrane protein HdeD (DUF308 family)
MFVGRLSDCRGRNVYKIERVSAGMKEKEMVVKHVDNSAGVVSVVFGILGVLLIIPFGFPAVIFGIISLCFALRQKKVHANAWATAGLWLSILSIVLGAVVGYMFVQGVREYFAQLQTNVALAQGAGGLSGAQ